EEEEADLAAYAEDLQEDAAFEELEEETHAAGDSSPSDVHVLPALIQNGEESHVPGEEGDVHHEAALEQAEAGAEELELEEAQEEAEALLEAEAIGAGTVDASAEVRTAPAEAQLLQRATRPSPGFDRRRGRRGGRRFRRRENTVVPQISEL